MAGVHKENQDDTRFAKESSEFNELIRDNRFRKALAWTQKWEKVRDLSNANRKKVLKDQQTVRMLGAAYYLGVARERSRRKRFHGALDALRIARTFTPSDPVLVGEIQKVKARIIVSGEAGQDWGEAVQKLLALKKRNPQDHTIDPTLGWAYSKLAESEYTSGRLSLAFQFTQSALAYDPGNEGAVRLKDRISRRVSLLVEKAEAAYRRKDFLATRDNLARALEIDPKNEKAREDWKILQRTPTGLVSNP
ncbi:MAG: hypothetical protein ACP5OP_08985 [Leptospirillia bacterium]